MRTPVTGLPVRVRRTERVRALLAAGITAVVVLSPATALAQPASPATPPATTTSTNVPDRAAPDVGVPNGVGPNVARVVRPQGQITAASYSLNTNPDGTVTRWDPCKTIPYQVNLAAKPDTLADVQEAVRQVSVAAGLQFRYDGPSSEIPQGQGGHSGAPLLISWANPQPGQPYYTDMLGTDPAVLGVGGWQSSTWSDQDGTHPWQIVSGFVAMSATAPMTPGSDASSQPSRVRTVMHEVAHAVGLNHTQDAAQVMYPYIDGRAAGWGSGDLQGLAMVGVPAGCIDPTPVRAPVFTAAAPPPFAVAGTTYTYGFAASGSPAPRFTVTDGALPAGLALDPDTGVLAGTPTTAGPAGFRVTAANGVNPAAVSPLLTITVAPAPAASAYTALTPQRITDTRAGSGAPNSGATLVPQGSLTVQLPPSVPAGASAVALSVTAVNPTQPGYLSVYPAGGVRNTTSVLNFVAGASGCTTIGCVVPNLVITPVSADGRIVIASGSGGAVDVVVDVQGYYDSRTATTSGAGHYYPVPTTRLTDTRCAAGAGISCGGLPPANSALSTLPPEQSIDVAVAGQNGIPARGVAAAVVQLTVTNTTANAYLTAYPPQGTKPIASNVNWVVGQSTSNRAIVSLDELGRLRLYNHAGNTDVVVDVVGYFSDASTPATGGALFNPVSPSRVIDTRAAGQTGVGRLSSQTVPVAGTAGIPSEVNGSPTAVAINLTDATANADSFLTVTPDRITPPATTSDLNFAPGEIRANAGVATLSPSGTLSVYNNDGTTDVVIDAFGYFTPAG